MSRFFKLGLRAFLGTLSFLVDLCEHEAVLFDAELNLLTQGHTF